MNRNARARNSNEMLFYASLESCAKCGVRVDPEKLNIYSDNDAWALTGLCRRCKEPISFTFRACENARWGAQPRGELGLGHSEIISPKQLIDEIERLSPDINVNPSQLAVTEWKANRDRNTRVSVCLAELLKFIPARAVALPVEILPAADRPDPAARPERYERSWMEAMLERCRSVSEANVAQLPRIEAAEKAILRNRPRGIIYLDHAALAAHEEWVRRGKNGKGRLVLVDAIHERTRIGMYLELSGARFDSVDFTDSYFENASFVEAEFESVQFERGHLNGTRLNGARVFGCSFEKADLRQTELINVRIRGTNFDGAELDHSIWSGASIHSAHFVETSFGNANLDGATFRDCDFRQADLGARDPNRPPPTRARFEHCDLRNSNWEGRDLAGAIFLECKFDGAKGLPSSAPGIVFEASTPVDTPSP